LLKTDKAGLTQGAVDYNIDRLQKAAQSGNSEAARFLSQYTSGEGKAASYLVTYDVSRASGAAYELVGAAGSPAANLMSGLPYINLNNVVTGVAVVSGLARTKTP